MKAVLQGDARADHDRGKAAMAWVADDRLAQCFREHGCLWSETEFEGYISKLQEEKQVN